MPFQMIARVVAALAASALLLIPPFEAAAQEPGSGEQPIGLASVVVDGEVLFKVRGATSFPADARAAGIVERIEAAAANPEIDPATVRAVPAGEFVDIYAGPMRIMSVVPADAETERLTVNTLAKVIEAQIRKAITGYRAARTPENLTASALRAIGALLAFAVATGGLLWLSRRLRARIDRELQARVQTVGIQSFAIVRAERVRMVVMAVTRVVVVVAVVGLTLFWLQYELAQFPWTREIGNAMVANTLKPLVAVWRALLDAIPNLVFLAILYYVLRGLLRIVRAFFTAVQRRTVELVNFEPEWAMPTYNLVRLAVIGLGLVVAYPYIPGSGSDAFKGVSLFAGIVFSLGSSSAIANMMAGYMMTYRRAFRIGDRVKIGDVVGDVTEMRLQVTHLRTLKNEEVVIPNSQIINGHVTNYSTLAKEDGLLLHTTVGIGYETPWRQVEAMLLEAARRTSGIATAPAPFVLQTALGDYAITYELNVGCDDAQRMAPLYSALHRNILDVFNEYGVAIMTPSYVADPADAKLVPKDKWHLPPAEPSKA